MKPSSRAPKGGSGRGHSRAGRVVPVLAQVLPLSEEWRFCADPAAEGEAEGWARPAFDDRAWESVVIPHSWNAHPAHVDYEGFAWYRRHFAVPADATEAHLRLHFDAVNYLARVWLNGRAVGTHEGGYTPFELDISRQVRTDRENVLSVQVDNLRALDRLPAALPEGRSFGWGNYGGIVRPVSLWITSRVYLEVPLIAAAPHLVDVDTADEAAVTAIVPVCNPSANLFDGSIVSDVVDEATGTSLLETPLITPVQVAPRTRADIRQAGTIQAPRLWHFDHPHLYRWAVKLQDEEGRVLHALAATFGVRTIEAKKGRFWLNGEPMRLAGITRHADAPGQGLAETAESMVADYDDLKRMNQVFSRPVHYPQSEFILDYCDRKGVLLIPEVPAWQLSANQMADSRIRALEQQQLREMILSEFNHPCIWAWSVGNELESDTAAGRAFVRDMVAYAKALDPTRPVGFASYHLLGGRPWADATAFTDFVLMNEYFGTWHGPKEALGPALEVVHSTWPEKTMIVSEFGFSPHWQRVEGPAHISPDHYYSIPEEADPGSEEADTQRCRVIREQMAIFRQHPYVAGAVFWTYQDHALGSGMMGVVDAQRRRRGSWEVLREEYAPVRIDSVSVMPGASGRLRAEIHLRARGPLEADMPAYTLRGYRLQWAVVPRDESPVLAYGDFPLPTIAPGEAWSGEATWPKVGEACVLKLTVVRPTGFAVIERSYAVDEEGPNAG